MLYTGLARHGIGAAADRAGQGGAAEPPRRLLGPVAAWYVGNILDRRAAARQRAARPHRLQDRHLLRLPRRLGGGLRRPHDHRRLGWAPGRRAGAGDRRPAAAAPILFDAFARTGHAPVPLARAPEGVVFSTTSRLPPPLQRFIANAVPGEASGAPRIMFPPNGARLELAGARNDPEPVALKIAGGHRPLTVMVNGVPLPAGRGRHTLFFRPDGPGFARLTVMDARGLSDSVMVRLQ